LADLPGTAITRSEELYPPIGGCTGTCIGLYASTMHARSRLRQGHRSWGGLPARDLVIAAALLLVALASVLMARPREGPLAICVPVAVVMTVSLGWRRRAPVACATAIAVAAQVQTMAGVSPGQLWALAAYLLAVYSVAAHLDEGIAAVAGVILVGGLLLQEVQDRGSDYLFILLVFGGCWLVGRAVRSWQARATFAETRQRDLAKLAVTEERVRMSRELHDIVAHGLSVIAVQADAAEAALAHDPTLAAEPLRAIKAGARESLQQMRQMLEILRGDEKDDPRAPQPGLDAVADVVASVRAAGLPVDFSCQRAGSAPDHLPGDIELAIYRIVQEALTNVLAHAGRTRTTVRLRITAADAVVEVCNDVGAAQRSDVGRVGRGLIGMRERVAALHGTFEAGPAAGGYRLRVRLPVEAALPAPGGSR